MGSTPTRQNQSRPDGNSYPRDLSAPPWWQRAELSTPPETMKAVFSGTSPVNPVSLQYTVRPHTDARLLMSRRDMPARQAQRVCRLLEAAEHHTPPGPRGIPASAAPRKNASSEKNRATKGKRAQKQSHSSAIARVRLRYKGASAARPGRFASRFGN